MFVRMFKIPERLLHVSHHYQTHTYHGSMSPDLVVTNGKVSYYMIEAGSLVAPPHRQDPNFVDRETKKGPGDRGRLLKIASESLSTSRLHSKLWGRRERPCTLASSNAPPPENKKKGETLPFNDKPDSLTDTQWHLLVGCVGSKKKSPLGFPQLPLTWENQDIIIVQYKRRKSNAAAYWPCCVTRTDIGLHPPPPYLPF
ncbi:hypothetical protein BDB00DRAFT_392061 [Zychaea mexicana]|uniref:uncharacterized protein n=1 Tax=Zychaea mexicana TaxID=64656 RepID=UPI0022FDF7BD|nr:uncharacterized protein BDB00DRAFT_392061 [Zychaea mexicana]KAI9498593.1 hypothetical protein BDB00DRAFT_392061 [Zychaea mexicana]